MQPDGEMFTEWMGHPVTEWVIACMEKIAREQQALWLAKAWEGDLDPLFLNEARTRTDCYRCIAESVFEDWKAIDDSED